MVYHGKEHCIQGGFSDKIGFVSGDVKKLKLICSVTEDILCLDVRQNG